MEWQERLSARKTRSAAESPPELAIRNLHDSAANGQEIFHQLFGLWRQETALQALASDLGFDKLLTQGSFGLLEPAPNMPVTLSQGVGRLFDRALLLDGPQNLAQPQTESVLAVGFQPDFDSRA